MEVSPYQCRTWLVLGMAWLKDPTFPEVKRKDCHGQLIWKVKPVCRTAAWQPNLCTENQWKRIILNRSVIDSVTISYEFNYNFFLALTIWAQRELSFAKASTPHRAGAPAAKALPVLRMQKELLGMDNCPLGQPCASSAPLHSATLLWGENLKGPLMKISISMTTVLSTIASDSHGPQKHSIDHFCHSSSILILFPSFSSKYNWFVCLGGHRKKCHWGKFPWKVPWKVPQCWISQNPPYEMDEKGGSPNSTPSQLFSFFLL